MLFWTAHFSVLDFFSLGLLFFSFLCRPIHVSIMSCTGCVLYFCQTRSRLFFVDAINHHWHRPTSGSARNKGKNHNTVVVWAYTASTNGVDSSRQTVNHMQPYIRMIECDRYKKHISGRLAQTEAALDSQPGACNGPMTSCTRIWRHDMTSKTKRLQQQCHLSAKYSRLLVWCCTKRCTPGLHSWCRYLRLRDHVMELIIILQWC